MTVLETITIPTATSVEMTDAGVATVDIRETGLLLPDQEDAGRVPTHHRLDVHMAPMTFLRADGKRAGWQE